MFFGDVLSFSPGEILGFDHFFNMCMTRVTITATAINSIITNGFELKNILILFMVQLNDVLLKILKVLA